MCVCVVSTGGCGPHDGPQPVRRRGLVFSFQRTALCALALFKRNSVRERWLSLCRVKNFLSAHEASRGSSNSKSISRKCAPDDLSTYYFTIMESFGCLPSGIRCDIQDNKGRCVFLESPATAGEVVLCNTPVSYALLQSDMERRCSYCCVKSAALLRCGRCRCVMYCNAHCQKQGWKQHKAECKLLPGLVRAAHHSQDQTLLNIRLVLHTEAARKAGNSGCTCSGDDRRGNSSCGISHVDSLSVGSEFDYSAVRRASGPAASKSKISASECEAMLARFDCNNFGILDELFSCVGAAVSPAVAMLNHSCRPNCILRYDLKQGSPPLIKVLVFYVIVYLVCTYLLIVLYLLMCL